MNAFPPTSGCPRGLASRRGVVLASGAIVALILGLLWIGYTSVQVKLQGGASYPRLSSYRSDPDGVKALHDALLAQGKTVLRNHTSLEAFQQLAAPHPSTIVFADALRSRSALELLLSDSANKGNMPEQTAYRLAHEGHTVLYAVAAPVSGSSSDGVTEEAEESKEAGSSTHEGSGDSPPTPPTPTEKGMPEAPSDTIAGEEHAALFTLGFTLKREAGWGSAGFSARPAKGAGYHKAIPWSGVFSLQLKRPEQWRPLYRMGGAPVIAERKVGRGRVIVIADPFLLSNGAMLDSRASEFLAMVFEGADEVWFDEAHLGLVSREGVIMLAQRYRLGWALGVLGLFSLLLTWHLSARLLPRRREGETGEEGEAVAVAEGSGLETLTLLLQRTLKRSDLLPTCLAEWNRAFARRRGPLSMPPREEASTPLSCYEQIAATLPTHQELSK